MDLVIFEENKPLILQDLGNGEFDYIESASEVYEADFFRFIKAKAILDNLARTYPTPRKKDTDADVLMRWFCTEVVRIFRSTRAFDREGIFIGDASYLFVPDNPNYENSVKLFFDQHNHPISSKQYEDMPDAQKAHCQRRRCYKMVTLLHTNRNQDFYFFVAVKVVPGNDHECPILYELVKQFVQTVGKGVMKRLILDRGFLDGQALSICKKEYGIVILIPIRRNMDIYEDAMALLRLPEVDWVR